MALSTKVGTLQSPSVTGSQTITGVGFQPKIVLFFTNSIAYTGTMGVDTRFDEFPGTEARSGSGITNAPDAMFMIGGGISATDNRVQGFLAKDGQDTTFTGSTRSSSKCISVVGGIPIAIRCDASIVSMDADGFTLNWSTVDVWTHDIHYIAIGGTAITNAKSGSGTVPTSVGLKSFNGLGFKPDLIFLFAVSAATIESNFSQGNISGCLGMACNNSQAYTGFRTRNNVTSSLTKSRQRTDKCFAHISDTDVFAEANLQTLDNDGFTLDFTTVSGTADYFYYIAIEGGSYKIDSINQPTSIGNQSESGIAFSPKLLLLMSDNKVSSGNTTDNLRLSFGASTVQDQKTSWIGDKHNVSVSEADSDLDENMSIKMMSEGVPTLNAQAKIVSFDTNGFTINWVNADSTQREVLYLLFGDAVSSDIQSKFVFHGIDTLSKTSKFIFQGAILSEKTSKIIFHGITQSNSQTRILWDGVTTSEKYRTFIVFGKQSSNRDTTLIFSGVHTSDSKSTFLFNGFVVSDKTSKIIFYGITSDSFIENLIFHGKSLIDVKKSFIYEGTLDSASGNYALFRVDLTSLPTTAVVYSARLDLTVGNTVGNYRHELWMLDATGRAWSDTSANWIYSYGAVKWSSSLGPGYAGGYSNRTNLVSFLNTSNDEQRVNLFFNSTGIAYVQSKAGSSVEFILLSDYTSDYASYRPVEDLDVDKRPKFVVDYDITSPSHVSYKPFIFSGKDDITKTKTFSFNGYDVKDNQTKIVFNGKSDKAIDKPFIIHGLDIKSNNSSFQFTGSLDASRAYSFIFFTDDIAFKDLSVIFNGIDTKTNTTKFIFMGAIGTNSYRPFIYYGQITSNSLSQMCFHGYTSLSYSNRIIFDGGLLQEKAMGFLFEGYPGVKKDAEILDHTKKNIQGHYISHIGDHKKSSIKDPYKIPSIGEKQKENVRFK